MNNSFFSVFIEFDKTFVNGCFLNIFYLNGSFFSLFNEFYKCSVNNYFLDKIQKRRTSTLTLNLTLKLLSQINQKKTFQVLLHHLLRKYHQWSALLSRNVLHWFYQKKLVTTFIFFHVTVKKDLSKILAGSVPILMPIYIQLSHFHY